MARSLGTLLCCVCFLASVPAGAETIKLYSGQSVQGKILKEEKDSILVDAGVDTPVTYFRDEIKAILPDEKVQPPAAVDPQLRAQADALEAQALELIDADQMDKGLAMVRQAVALDPTPQRHMNYGSILFGNGVALFKQAQAEEGKKILRLCEEQLHKAIEGFNKDKDAVFLAQAYFLLGEMYNNAFADPAKAKEFYSTALTFSDHDGAKAALAKIK